MLWGLWQNLIVSVLVPHGHRAQRTLFLLVKWNSTKLMKLLTSFVTAVAAECAAQQLAPQFVGYSSIKEEVQAMKYPKREILRERNTQRIHFT